MNLKTVSDSELLQTTKQLAIEERRIGIEVLHHLREIDERKLFASLGFSSLFSYCTQELCYSEGGAYRRISAMKLLREVPQYESKLREGTVTVATLSKVQSFLVQEKRQLGKTYSKAKKLGVLRSIEGKSAKQTDRFLATLSPKLAAPDQEKIINQDQVELRITVNREVMEKLEHLKDLLGHKSKTHTYSGLLDELANLALDQLDPEKRSARRKENLRRKPIKIEAPKVADQSLPPVETASVPKAKRYVPRVTKDALWNRETGRCSFIDPKTKRRCPSRHALQIEHIVPFAKGGTSDLQNLTLLCQAHNQYSAIQSFGLGKMQKHWSRQSQELD